MAGTTKQQTAIVMAGQVVAFSAALQQLRDSIATFLVHNTDYSPDTFWRLMATAPVPGDGTISGTPDGTPVLTNPITEGNINRAEADLLTGLTLLIELNEFFAGTLPTNRAAINRNPTIDVLAG